MLNRIKAVVSSSFFQLFVLCCMLFMICSLSLSYGLAVKEVKELQEQNAQLQLLFNDKSLALLEAQERLEEQGIEMTINADNYAKLVKGATGQPRWSPKDISDVVSMVIAESGNQSLSGQMAVAQCIYDRYKYGYGGDTIQEILASPGQFTDPYTGDTSLYPRAYEAVVRVFIYGERVFDADCIYFYNPVLANPSAVSAFEASNQYLGTIGDHVFRSW